MLIPPNENEIELSKVLLKMPRQLGEDVEGSVIEGDERLNRATSRFCVIAKCKTQLVLFSGYNVRQVAA
jgi:hypothetical protein